MNNYPPASPARQRVFDYVMTKLREQGRRSMMSEHSGMCAYRGHDGARCAVGHMIPDDVYHEDIELEGILQLLGNEPESPAGAVIRRLEEDWGLTLPQGNYSFVGHSQLPDDVRFLKELQLAHDQESNPWLDEFEPSMQRLAARWSLTYTARGDAA